MENLNFKLVQTEARLNQILDGIPVGIAYFILKTKVNELEEAYYQQAKIEMDAVAAQQQPIDQTENEQVQTEIQNEPTTA